MGSQKSGNQTVNQKADPWDQAQAYLAGYDQTSMQKTIGQLEAAGMDTAQARALMSSAKTVVGILPEAERVYREGLSKPFDKAELTAMRMMDKRVNRDYSLTNTGADTMMRTARGDFLGQDNFMDAYGEDILNAVDSRFAKTGRTGSAYASQAAAKGLTQAAAPLYQAERQMMQQAALASPQFQAGQYGLLDSDINALLQSGAMRRNRGNENLDNYANLVLAASGQGGVTQTQQPMYSNPGAGAVGGAMAGYQMGGPWGAVIGGGLGYLSSR